MNSTHNCNADQHMNSQDYHDSYKLMFFTFFLWLNCKFIYKHECWIHELCQQSLLHPDTQHPLWWAPPTVPLASKQQRAGPHLLLHLPLHHTVVTNRNKLIKTTNTHIYQIHFQRHRCEHECYSFGQNHRSWTCQHSMTEIWVLFQNFLCIVQSHMVLIRKWFKTHFYMNSFFKFIQGEAK